MRTLTATVLRTLVISATLAFAPSTVAIETLVDPEPASNLLTSGKHASTVYDSVMNNVTAFPHYVGTVNATAAVRKRGFTLRLPESGDLLTLENLELTEIEDGYALSAPTGAKGPVLDMVIMGAVVRSTLLVGDEDLYVITPLGNGNAVVHRQDPDGCCGSR